MKAARPLLVVLLLLAAPPRAAGEEPVCVVLLPAAAAGPERAGERAAALAAAWRLEQRKAGRAAALVVAADDAECPAESTLRVVVAPDERAHFTAADGAAFARELGGLSPAEQAQVVARAALDALGAAEAAALPFRAPAPPAATLHAAGPDADADADADAAGPPALRWGAAVGGAYLLQAAPGPHRGALEVEAQAAFLDEALLVALRLGWGPSQALRKAAAPADLETLAVGARAAWGLWLDPLWLRLGAGVEAERRALSARPTTRWDTLEDLRWALVLTAGAALEWPLGPHLRATLDLGARLSPWGTGARWQGKPVYEAPVVVGAAALRVGWWF